jgi:preprotein translocase subunit YajC
VQNGGQLLLLGVLVAFTVWVFSRGRRQQREMQATQARLRAGAEVMMTSGLYGRVVELTDEGHVRLETSPGAVSRWDRRAVARILSSPEEPGTEPGAGPPGVATLEPSSSAEPAVPAEPPGPVEPARPAQDTAPPDRD